MKRKKGIISEEYRFFNSRVSKINYSKSMKLRKTKRTEICIWCKSPIQKGRVYLKWQEIIPHTLQNDPVCVTCFACIPIQYKKALKSLQKIRTLTLNHRRYFIKNYDKIKEREMIAAL